MNTIILPTCKGSYIINPKDIVRIQSSSNYSKLFFTNQKPLLVAKVLRWFDDILDSVQFSRIHKSHLINLSHVKDIEFSSNLIHMYNGEAVQISKRRKRDLKRQLVLKYYL